MSTKSLVEIIEETESRHGLPQGKVEAWTRQTASGDCVVFSIPTENNAMPIMGYGEVVDAPEKIPSRYVFLRANADGLYEDQDLLIPLQMLTYPIPSDHFEAARISGFPTHPSRVNVFVGFVEGGAA